MRVLFAIDPSLAHLYPMVPTAWALQNAGHDVRLASFAGFADSIAATGLTPVPLGDASRPARLDDNAIEPHTPEETIRYAEVMGLTAEEREHWYLYYQYLLTPTADYLRVDRPEPHALVEFAKAWRPDVIIRDLTQVHAGVAARLCGAAAARMVFAYDPAAWALDKLAAHHDALVAAGLDPNPLATLVRPLADRYGVEIDQELLVGQWTIEPCPPGMDLPTSTRKVRVRYQPYNGSQTMPAWLLEPQQRPRIALTLGESYRRFLRGDWDRTPKLLEALSGLDVEVVATLNDVQLDGARPPANVRLIDYLPLTQLLPTCTAVIHHGGLGTFQASIASRIPQMVCDTEESILMRLEEDKGDDVGVYRSGVEYGVREAEELVTPVMRWVLPEKKLEATPVSNYVISRGAGIRLNHRTHSVLELREQIQRVLDNPSYRRGAQAVYDVWRAMPSPNEIVPVLETLTWEGKSRR